jgi:hypothetical protein
MFSLKVEEIKAYKTLLQNEKRKKRMNEEIYQLEEDKDIELYIETHNKKTS